MTTRLLTAKTLIDYLETMPEEALVLISDGSDDPSWLAPGAVVLHEEYPLGEAITFPVIEIRTVGLSKLSELAILLPNTRTYRR